MADNRPLTVRVPKADLDRLNALAQTTRRSKSDLASEALAAYLAVQDWHVAAIRDAVDAADAGAASIPRERVTAWLQSWGSTDELLRPR